MFHFSLLVLVSAISLATSSSTYQSRCDTAFCKILDNSLQEITALKKGIDEGICVPSLGQKADTICNFALEQFSQEAPLPDESKSNEVLYDKKIEDLERYLDAPLHVLYLKQLSLIREKALKIFKASLASSETGSEYDAMMQADEMFRREAEDSTRQTPDWSYSKELQNFKSSLSEISSRSRKIQEVKLQAAKQNQQAMQYLQMQAQQLQAIQQQIQGSGSPWNAALAYRIPDSSINLAMNYQQGRATVQVSCVPDESAPLLGSNGFVNGVTPGNVGLSFNINI